MGTAYFCCPVLATHTQTLALLYIGTFSDTELQCGRKGAQPGPEEQDARVRVQASLPVGDLGGN